MTSVTIQKSTYTSRQRFADWILALAAILGFVEAVLNYFFDTGIAYSQGALLVVVSTFLILAVLVLVRWWTTMPRWLGILLAVLTFLDFIGTAIAGYFLEAYLLVLLMAVALIAWLFAVFMRPATPEAVQ